MYRTVSYRTVSYRIVYGRILYGRILYGRILYGFWTVSYGTVRYGTVYGRILGEDTVRYGRNLKIRLRSIPRRNNQFVNNIKKNIFF